MKIAYVIGTIAPYTHENYEAIGQLFPGGFTVFCCAEIEPTRNWQVPPAVHYRRIVMPGLRWHRSDTQSIYLNPSILIELEKMNPDIVVLGGLSPTMVLGGLYTLLRRWKLGISTDGVPDTDPGRHSWPHRLIRKLLIPRADFGLGACAPSITLLESYGLPKGTGTVTSIIPAWSPKNPPPSRDDRAWDLLFCGRLDDRKGVPFLIELLQELVQRGQKPSIRIAGIGPLEDSLRSALVDLGLKHQFDGYVQTAQLEDAFSSARLFLFPSRFDPWGLVANEAIQCGTPVIGSPHATACRELIAPTGAGLVMPLEVGPWADAVVNLLSDATAWEAQQQRTLRAASDFDRAVVIEAHRLAFEKALKSPAQGSAANARQPA